MGYARLDIVLFCNEEIVKRKYTIFYFDTGYFFDNIASREIDFKGFEQYFKLPFKQIIVC